MKPYNPRLTPARPDLAAAHLRGEVEAARYVEGRRIHLHVEVADLRPKPSRDASVDTQVLYGENMKLYDERDGWAWVQLKNDNYVGYIARDALAEGEATPTHRICVHRTFIYPEPDVKAPTLIGLPLGARVQLTDDQGDFVRLAQGGFVFARHVKPYDDRIIDFVAVAEGFLGTIYLWGGKTGLGIDCSGLVQVSLAEAGIASPRDSVVQEGALGTPLPITEDLEGLRRGDLIFWKGHVGIMRDAHELLHANAYHMRVATEPLVETRDRIRQRGGGEITAIKRL